MMKLNKKGEEGASEYNLVLWIAIIIAIFVILLIILKKYTNLGNVAWNKIKNIILPFR